MNRLSTQVIGVEDTPESMADPSPSSAGSAIMFVVVRPDWRGRENVMAIFRNRAMAQEWMTAEAHRMNDTIRPATVKLTAQ